MSDELFQITGDKEGVTPMLPLSMQEEFSQTIVYIKVP